MNALRKIDKILNRVRSVVLVALLVSMMGMCTMNVVLRYLIKGVSFLRPFSWVNEMMQMLAIWVVFLAAGLGVRQDAHVSLESFTEKYLPAKASRILHKAAQVIVIATLVLLIVIGIQQTIKMRTSFLQNLPISNAWFYAAIPVGCAYLLYEYILILVFGKNPFASSPGEDDNVTGAI